MTTQEILNQFKWLDVELVFEDNLNGIAWFYFPPIFADFHRPRMLLKVNFAYNTLEVHVSDYVITYNRNVYNAVTCCLNNNYGINGILTLFNNTVHGYGWLPTRYPLIVEQFGFAIPHLHNPLRYYVNDTTIDREYAISLDHSIEIYNENNIICL